MCLCGGHGRCDQCKREQRDATGAGIYTPRVQHEEKSLYRKLDDANVEISRLENLLGNAKSRRDRIKKELNR